MPTPILKVRSISSRGTVPKRLKMFLENWWHWPGSEVDDRGGAARQKRAWEVLGDSCRLVTCAIAETHSVATSFLTMGQWALVRPHQFVADFSS